MLSPLCASVGRGEGDGSCEDTSFSLGGEGGNGVKDQPTYLLDRLRFASVQQNVEEVDRRCLKVKAFTGPLNQ